MLNSKENIIIMCRDQHDDDDDDGAKASKIYTYSCIHAYSTRIHYKI